jgi:hypothetical protein
MPITRVLHVDVSGPGDQAPAGGPGVSGTGGRGGPERVVTTNAR